MRRMRKIGLTMMANVVLVIITLTLLMMVFPQLIFGSVTYQQRTTANQTMHIEYRHRDGDLFVALPGAIRPPEDDSILEQIDIAWDENGFRQPAEPASTYPIAIFGDSFTESVNVSRPYADVLAGALEIGVRNFGYRAYGPREVAIAAEEMIAKEPREWVIYGYFSGNDLGDTVRGAKVDVTPLGVWSALVERLNTPHLEDSPREGHHYDFPMPVIIGGNYYEMAFLSYYWWWHTGNIEDYLQSRNFAVISESLDRIASATPDETCLLLMFIPTKEQLYYPYIYETERQWIRGIANRVVLDSDTGLLWMKPEPVDASREPAFIDALTHQRDALKALIDTKPRWYWFDLLPVFEKAVSDGELLYYPYDSHWNQAGHDLAGVALADFLRESPECGQ